MIDRTDDLVVVHCDDEGFLSILIGPKVTAQVIMVDDRCPNDRAYLMTLRSSSDEIRTAIGDSPIGHAGDDKHAAVVRRIGNA